ncbi:MAG TPA: sialidase family protein, partial [Acidimicrobiales bacterium]|nr:sialidase family protein [Acidimicrobiales bacterium]
MAGLLSVVAPAPAGAVVIGNPSNATARTGNEDESAVAVNPNNSQQIAVMTNGIAGDAGLPLSFSSDGGQTWTRTVFATGTGAGGDGRPTACCDPTLSWDNHGNLFVGYLQRNPRTIELYVTNNLGTSFTNLGPVDTGAAGSLDQPTVVAGVNSVWVTWRDDSGGIAARGRSVTGPLTFGAWGAEQDISTVGNYGDIAIGPAGEVMVVYQDQSGGQGPTNIIVHTDADGLGAGGFGAGVTVTTSNVGGFDFLPAQPDRSWDAEAGLAWDRSGGANNNRVYLVYTDETPNESNDFDIFVRWSDNDGATWSAAVQVNDDAGTNSQGLPKIAVDQTAGTVCVSFYDARGDTGGGRSATDLDGTAHNDVTLFASWSTNGGANWAANVA